MKRCIDTDDLINKDEENENPVNPDNPETPPEDVDEDSECPLQFMYPDIPDFYERVRHNLNVGSMISDNVIDYFENAPMAEIKIKSMVKNWKELDEMKKMMLESCIIYMTCYKLCPIAFSMRVSRQKDPSLEIDFFENKNDSSSCERFLEMIDELMSDIKNEERDFSFGFRVTKGSGCIKPCWPYGFIHGS